MLVFSFFSFLIWNWTQSSDDCRQSEDQGNEKETLLSSSIGLFCCKGIKQYLGLWLTGMWWCILIMRSNIWFILFFTAVVVLWQGEFPARGLLVWYREYYIIGFNTNIFIIIQVCTNECWSCVLAYLKSQTHLWTILLPECLLLGGELPVVHGYLWNT